MRDMAATINTAIEADIPKVFVGLHKKFTENPEVFLTGRVMGNILPEWRSITPFLRRT